MLSQGLDKKDVWEVVLLLPHVKELGTIFLQLFQYPLPISSTLCPK